MGTRKETNKQTYCSSLFARYLGAFVLRFILAVHLKVHLTSNYPMDFLSERFQHAVKFHLTESLNHPPDPARHTCAMSWNFYSATLHDEDRLAHRASRNEKTPEKVEPLEASRRQLKPVIEPFKDPNARGYVKATDGRSESTHRLYQTI